MRKIVAKPIGKTVIGKHGENLATQVFFPTISGLGASLIVTRAGDKEPSPRVTETSGNSIVWTVNSWDTDVVGYVDAEVDYTDESGTVVKSATYTFEVVESLGTPSETVPDPYEDWYADILAASQEAKKAEEGAVSAQSAAEAAQTSAQASATAAAASETAAAKSAAKAATSESIAAESEFDARTAKEKALAAAEEAAKSSDAAKTSMTAAKAAQTAAEEAKDTSVSYSKEAVRAASEAGISEDKAAGSATAAAQSAEEAKQDYAIEKARAESAEQANADAITAETERAEAAESQLSDELETKVDKPGDWVLKGTITTDNVADGVTVDMAGCSELIIIFKNTSSASNVSLWSNIGQMIYNTTFSQVGERQGLFVWEDFFCGIRSTTAVFNGNYTQKWIGSNGSGYSYVGGQKISDITNFYINNPTNITDCDLKIYAR